MSPIRFSELLKQANYLKSISFAGYLLKLINTWQNKSKIYITRQQEIPSNFTGIVVYRRYYHWNDYTRYYINGNPADIIIPEEIIEDKDIVSYLKSYERIKNFQ